MERKDLGSWLQGPPQLNDQSWPGQRLGRPESGPASIARFGPRVVALCIDWGLAMLVSWLFFDAAPWANLLWFAVMQLVFVGVTGHSVGHRVMGMQVQRLDGTGIRPLDGVVRTLLLCLVVPPLVADGDQRGLHDRVVKTILVRTR
ncbi:RDD family protein [Zafaria sp. Z1313]|uniref:RDD family protein n=1 Tax=unclassified Zafaria TaxID=2828765 RepID=UPI002E7A3902|nr:RDD family protein [Zafaria sp. J156]MEE1620265.1 RDD family protein [Zafaria sp. J156]